MTTVLLCLDAAHTAEAQLERVPIAGDKIRVSDRLCEVQSVMFTPMMLNAELDALGVSYDAYQRGAVPLVYLSHGLKVEAQS